MFHKHRTSLNIFYWLLLTSKNSDNVSYSPSLMFLWRTVECHQISTISVSLNNLQSMPYGEADVQNLKSQVLTLIKEVQESSAKLTSTTRTLEKKSARYVLAIGRYLDECLERCFISEVLILSPTGLLGQPKKILVCCLRTNPLFYPQLQNIVLSFLKNIYLQQLPEIVYF